MTSIVITACVVAISIGQCSAGDFLGIAKVSMQDLESQLLEGLSKSASSEAKTSKKHLLDLETALRPMFNVVPKESDGTLGHNVVRYVLHRFFVRRHGWFIRGLEPGSESTNSSVIPDTQRQHEAPSNASKQALQDLREWVPTYLQSFLETIIGGRGVNLRELAVFAAILEDLIHKEENGHLHKAYHTLWLREQDPLDHEDTFHVLETYMMIFMLGGNFTIRNPDKAQMLLRMFSKKVASWDKMLLWLARIQHKTQPPHGSADFSMTSKIVTEIGERYGVFNDGECGRLKAELMKMESRRPGRVRLSDFYKRALFGAWEFNEKIEYLRSAGLVDETEKDSPMIILPNYVASRSNCLATSSFYAVCCRNECEDLMEHVEGEIGDSTARPLRIAKIISKLSTNTVQAPRSLSKSLMQRLQEVASMHQGKVPIHGRLFAQWMHHAFPRECPYPNAAGTASPLTPHEWMQKSGVADSKASEEEMRYTIRNENCKFAPKGVECSGVMPSNNTDDEDLPWDGKEELLILREKPTPPAFSYPRLFKGDGLLHPARDIVCWLSFVSLSMMASALWWGWKSKTGKICWASWTGVLGAAANAGTHV